MSRRSVTRTRQVTRPQSRITSRTKIFGQLTSLRRYGRNVTLLVTDEPRDQTLNISM